MTSPFETTIQPVKTEQAAPQSEITDRVTSQVELLRQQTPLDKRPEVIGNLKKFLRLKTLAETSYQNLPEDLRHEIGTRDPQDVFQEALDDDETADLWFDLQGAYGKDWSTEDVARLIDGLEV